MPPRDHWREFPRELTSIDEVPDVLRDALGSRLPPPDRIVYSFLIPQPRSFWDWFRDNPPRNTVFILTADERVLIAREGVREADVTECALGNVISMDVGTILLNSWLTLAYATQGGVEEIRLEYGTIFERSFRKAVLWMRAVSAPDPLLPPQHVWRMPGEECIRSLPIKFNNAARNYWLSGETALDACFIAPISTQERGFGWRRRTIPPAAIVVSDHGTLVIKEQSATGPGRWGQTWHFCPLTRIQSIRIEQEHLLPHLRIQLALAEGGPIRDLWVPFGEGERQEVERVVAHLQREGMVTK